MFFCHFLKMIVELSVTHLSEELSLCVPKHPLVSCRVMSIAAEAAAGLKAQGFVMVSSWAGTI